MEGYLMANPDHLKILELGAEAWNKWRKENPKINPNLVGAIIQGKNLSGIDLRKTDLSRAHLEGSNLFAAEMEGARLQWAHLEGATLEDARMQHTNLEAAHLEEANLQRANLNGATLTRAKLDRTDLRESNLSGTITTRISYTKDLKCLGVNITGCHGSQRFVRHVMDLDYIEETREKHPIKHFIWSYTSDCGRSWELWLVWCIGIIGIFAILFDRIEEKSPLLVSINAFTSFGFVDTQMSTQWGPLLCWIEIALGYVMFASLVSLIVSQMARRSG